MVGVHALRRCTRWKGIQTDMHRRWHNDYTRLIIATTCVAAWLLVHPAAIALDILACHIIFVVNPIPTRSYGIYRSPSCDQSNTATRTIACDDEPTCRRLWHCTNIQTAHAIDESNINEACVFIALATQWLKHPSCCECLLTTGCCLQEDLMPRITAQPQRCCYDVLNSHS
jgi:hypothetical protein